MWVLLHLVMTIYILKIGRSPQVVRYLPMFGHLGLIKFFLLCILTERQAKKDFGMHQTYCQANDTGAS
jgi:hypothetical protein